MRQSSCIDTISGVICPIITPLKADETLDKDAFARVIGHVVSGGADGIFVMGSSGEFANLDIGVRFAAAEVAVEEAGGRVPVLVGVSDCSTQRSKELAVHAKKAGADAIVICPPYYFPVGDQVIMRHFGEIIEGAGLPAFVYNIPQTTKVAISVQLMQRLSRAFHVAGIKDSSGDFIRFQELLESPELSGLRILQGEERLFAASVLAGAHGGVPAMANVAPRLYSALYEAAGKGDLKETRRLHRLVVRATSIYSMGSVYGAVKEALRHLGILKDGRVTVPLGVPTAEESEMIRGLIRDLEKQGYI